MSDKQISLAVERWIREVEGHLRFLEKLPTVPIPLGAGETWRQGMRTYYIRRVRHFLDTAPRGQERARKAFEARLAKV